MEAIPRKFSPEELVALTAAERRQLGSEFDARKAAAEMAMRQWCIEQAHGHVGNAHEIFHFVTEPLKPEVPK
jgi:hypothetical protein